MVKQVIPAAELGLNQAMVNPDALQVVARLQQNGHAAYIVGGGVRDLVLGRHPKDFDIVTDAVPERIRRIFGRNSMIIGRRFKIVHVYFEHLNQERSQKIGKACYERHILEVSTYRSNQVHQHSLSEHGRILVDNNYGSIDEDAFRRDFTVNALYYDPLAEQVIDYHAGVDDIQHRILRVIGNPYERYLEDPVRVLRAIRLSEKLGLTIDEATYINFRNAKHLLLNEPRGRLFEEMLKILLSGTAEKIMHELKELGIPRRVFPLLDKLFFSPTINPFAARVLAKTDARIASGEDVSLVFILAGLGWDLVQATWQQLLHTNTDNLRPALCDAIARQHNFMYNCGITRNLLQAMREIWLLQIDFEYPVVENLEHWLMSHNRVRQAWHLFSLRHEFNQVDSNLYTWWDNFLNNETSDKTQLLIDLVEIIPDSPLKKKRKKKRRRKKTKHETAE